MFRARLLGIVVIAAVLLSGCANNLIIRSPSGTTTNLILLRHADRNVLSKDLDDGGRARAAALPAALEGIQIDAIYSPDFSRNLDTVAPLAKQRGLTVKVIPVSRVVARLNRNEVFTGGYTYYPGDPMRVWDHNHVGKAIFYHTRELNERFLGVVT